MRITEILTRTVKEVSQDETSLNASLLIRAGYVDRLMAGVYSYLPLGLKVLNNIENIIREEMNKIGSQEILMPALQPKEIWEQTGRWNEVDVLYKLTGSNGKDLALGATHEEVVTPLIAQFINSYRDLPKSTYQIQTKFRNELRAKSGLLRGREFRMKDMYSFHTDQDQHDKFYNETISAYQKIYDRCGIGDITYLTYADGGIFSKYSHEFQTITEKGEDIVYKLANKNIAINKEIIDDKEALKEIIPNYEEGDEEKLLSMKAIEVGNIFKLGSKFSDSFNRTYQSELDNHEKILMGCYGIGSSRVMGTIAECLSDDKGLVWPSEIAPYQVYMISLARNEEEDKKSEELYINLLEKGIEVLFDDRKNVNAGQKFNDADLLGIPHRLVISGKTIKEDKIEYKSRTSEETKLISLESFFKLTCLVKI